MIRLTAYMLISAIVLPACMVVQNIPANTEIREREKPDAGTVVDDAEVHDGGDAQTVDAGAPLLDGKDGGQPSVAVDAGPGVPPLPFQAPPESGSTLVDVSTSLNEVLENGSLGNACAEYGQNPTSQQAKLKCGKYMFFYEGFGTLGVPKALVEFMSRSFPDELGIGQSKLGLVPDPYASPTIPLGLGSGAPLGLNQTYAYTCASCHFAQIPDGRYAVGAANHEYEYGRQTLATFLLPASVQIGFDESEHNPNAVAKVSDLLDKIDEDSGLRWELRFDLLPLLFGSSVPALTGSQEGQYASWPSGTQDFIIPPLGLDDSLHTVSKIIPLWDLTHPDEEQDYNMEHSHLAWTGGAPDLMTFLESFVSIGAGDTAYWTEARLEPLHDYIMSLRSPETTAPIDAESTTWGEELFMTRGCVACHDGPRGEGTRVFSYNEIGTDDAMALWGQGTSLLGDADVLPWGIKAPRLSGLFTQERFLHNGSLDSLEQLLCLDDRGEELNEPRSNRGHLFGCDLSDAERTALVDWLNSL